MTIAELVHAAEQGPVDFQTTMQVIDNNYEFTPTAFTNGNTENAENTNNGSCKLFAFAQLNQISQQAALNLFGDFYTKDVLENPDGDDHQNIRNFMQSSFDGLQFTGQALTSK
ncbi:HopJ type III effector protein [Thiomicrorhabdus sp. 6S2-11]|uniref:HopJ type III effector protein n=2 Tax=Thiomicrorhabdus marina TaxID=2818442 RepID=A0ABS3Q2T5_9GAMM|nr:HopJ type III effector protein [Thiomicrorhabdus marina]